MKLLYILPSLETGGAELQTINQLNFLHEHHPDIKAGLLITSSAAHLKNKLNIPEDNIYINYTNEKFSVIDKRMIWKLPSIVFYINKVLKEFSPTHIIAILPFAHLCTRIALKFFCHHEVKLFTYYRDVYFEVNPIDNFSKKAIWKMNSWLAKFDNGTFFNSLPVYENIDKNQFVWNPLILPNSLPGEQEDEKKGKELLTKHNYSPEYLLLVPGRLHSKKGHKLFLCAFYKLVKSLNVSYPQIGVVIAGEGNELKDLLSICEHLELKQEVLFLGEVENRNLLSLYKVADLVVIPSLHEGFGNVAIEGLMQGATMLVSNTGGLGDIIRHGDNGFTFTRGAQEDLYEMLKKIYLKEIYLQKDKHSLYMEFKERYSLDKQVAQILKHLDS